MDLGKYFLTYLSYALMPTVPIQLAYNPVSLKGLLSSISAKTIKIKNVFVCFSFFCLILSFCCISSVIIAGNTKIINQQRHSTITDGSDVPSKEVYVHKVISAESLWFGYDETVTIATKLETRISKAPGIVTVITAE